MFVIYIPLVASGSCTSEQSLEGYCIDTRAMSDLLGPSESEMFQVKKDLMSNLHIIDTAEQKAGQVLESLQALWLNVDEKATIPKLTSVSTPVNLLLPS